jgi:hypothetical protein
MCSAGGLRPDAAPASALKAEANSSSGPPGGVLTAWCGPAAGRAGHDALWRLGFLYGFHSVRFGPAIERVNRTHGRRRTAANVKGPAVRAHERGRLRRLDEPRAQRPSGRAHGAAPSVVVVGRKVGGVQDAHQRQLPA